MKRTVIRDFIYIMKATNNWNKDRWNKTSSVYEFPNGSFIEFVGVQDAGIGKGFRRDIVYFNEANRGIRFESYQQIASRAKLIYIDFNPDREFWVHREVLPYEDCDFLILTFQDNEALSISERSEILAYKMKGFINPDAPDTPDNIKNAYWANKWRVYGLGLPGVLDGQIYNWPVVDSLPPEAELISYGLDFGFNDPTVLVALYKYGEGYIVDELLYRSRLDPDMIRDSILSLELNNQIEIKADGSRPELISMLKRAGVTIAPVDKSNKNDRILLLSAEKISVTRRSANLIEEMSGYVWKKSGEENKDVPIEYDDHGMDATLYAADKVILRMKPKMKVRWRV